MVLDAPNAQQELLRSVSRQFTDSECSLRQRIDIEERGDFRSLWERSVDLGWPGMLVPERNGGAGASLADATVVFEELGRALVPGPHLSSSVLATQLLLRASAPQDERLAAMANGSRVAVVALTESAAGWDPEAVSLEAIPDAGGYLLRGRKQYVLDADQADEFLVVARAVDSGELIVIAVAKSATGLAVREMRGWNGQPFFEIAFERVAAPASAVVIAPGNAGAAIRGALDAATAVLCAYIVGASERVYELSLQYAQTRRQFGQAIARFQRVQDHLIDMRGATDRARVATLQAVQKFERGDASAGRSVSMAKVLASEGFFFSCEAAHHVHAGVGSDKKYGLYLYTKASHTYYHYLGGPAEHEARIAGALGF